jgi:hypothetical protein
MGSELATNSCLAPSPASALGVAATGGLRHLLHSRLVHEPHCPLPPPLGVVRGDRSSGGFRARNGLPWRCSFRAPWWPARAVTTGGAAAVEFLERLLYKTRVFLSGFLQKGRSAPWLMRSPGRATFQNRTKSFNACIEGSASAAGVLCNTAHWGKKRRQVLGGGHRGDASGASEAGRSVSSSPLHISSDLVANL